MIGSYSVEFPIRLSHGGQRIGSNRNGLVFIVTKCDSHIISTFAPTIIRDVRSHVGTNYACTTYIRLSATKN